MMVLSTISMSDDVQFYWQ